MINTQNKQTQNNGLFKILFILTIPYIAFTFSHSGFLALLPFIREEFILTRTEVGYYSTFFFLSSAILAVITGSMVDRLGPKRGLLIGVGCVGFMNLLYGLSPTYIVLLFLALIAGVGQSIITPSLNKGVMIESPPGKRAVSMGIMQSGVGIGGFAGASLLPLLGESMGWRAAIQFAGIFALLMVLLIFKLYHEGKGSNYLANNQESQVPKPPSLRDNMQYFFTKKQFIFICLFGAVLGGSGVGAVLPHLTVFLSEDLLMSPVAAGFGLGIFQLGGIIGRLAWGWFSDQLLQGDRKKTLSLIGLSSGVMFLIPGIFFNNPQISTAVVYIFSFLLGFSIFGGAGVLFVAAGEFAGEDRTGGATGIALLFNRAGILTAPPLFGLIADRRESYDYSWIVFGAILILASILFNRVSGREKTGQAEIEREYAGE